MWQVGGIVAGDVVVVDIPIGIVNAIGGDSLEDGRWGVGGRHLSCDLVREIVVGQGMAFNSP